MAKKKAKRKKVAVKVKQVQLDLKPSKPENPSVYCDSAYVNHNAGTGSFYIDFGVQPHPSHVDVEKAMKDKFVEVPTTISLVCPHAFIPRLAKALSDNYAKFEKEQAKKKA